MATLNISVDEWLNELQKLTNQPQKHEGFTTEELVSKLGKSNDKIRRFLRQAIAEGRVEVIFRSGTSIAGNRTRVPAYKLKGSTLKEIKRATKKR